MNEANLLLESVRAIGGRDYKIVLWGRYVGDPPETRILVELDGIEPTTISDNLVEWVNVWVADYHGYLDKAAIQFPGFGKQLRFIMGSSAFVTGAEFTLSVKVGYGNTDGIWEDIQGE